MARTFLLSPARCDGERAKLILKEQAEFPLARALRAPNGAGNGNVFQLAPLTDLSQKQTAAAHVPAADELARKDESLPEGGKERVGVFAGRDASQQDDFVSFAECARQGVDVAPEGAEVSFVATRDVHLREGTQIARRHACFG